MKDHRKHYRLAQVEMAELIGTIEDDQLALPTPCSEWKVRDLLRHLVGANYDEVAVFEGQEYDPSTDPRLAADPRRQYAESADRDVAAVADDSVLEQTVPFVGRENPGWVRISFHFLDIVTHSWDLRKALGAPGELDPELAAAGIEVAELIPDAEWVRGPGKPFGAIVPVPDDASPVDRMLSLVGRSPDWTPAPA